MSKFMAELPIFALVTVWACDACVIILLMVIFLVLDLLDAKRTNTGSVQAIEEKQRNPGQDSVVFYRISHCMPPLSTTAFLYSVHIWVGRGSEF